MRCSECSHEIRPVVAVDIDGTLGDYHGHFLRFAADYLGIVQRPPGSDYEYNGSIKFSTFCISYFRIDLATYRQIKLAYRQGGMKRTMPIFDGAERIPEIQKAGAELWVTTTRPFLSLDNVIPDTVEWLRRHEITYRGILFDEDKYHQLAERIDRERVVAILDDLPEMYDAAVAEFDYPVPILVQGHYNRAVERPVTCDLNRAIDLAISHVRAWRLIHDGT